jgi:hypothetical protein
MSTQQDVVRTEVINAAFWLVGCGLYVRFSAVLGCALPRVAVLVHKRARDTIEGEASCSAEKRFA